MSSELISEYTVSHGKPKAFYDLYERKEELQHQTHYCPGCGHGIVGRILKAVTAEARAGGINVGLLRPITLYPFPVSNFQRLAQRARVFVVVEMSNGQLVEDVRLALNGARPVEFLNRMGGNVPSHDEVLAFVRELARRTLRSIAPEEERMAHV